MHKVKDQFKIPKQLTFFFSATIHVMQNTVLGLQTKSHMETNLDTRNKISIISPQKWNKPR